jgi:hypothetical protein
MTGTGPTRRGHRAGLAWVLAAAATVLVLMAPAAPAAGATAPVAGTDAAAVARSLASDPLYISSAPGTAQVSAGDVRGALPPDLYVAVLPASASAQVGQGEAAAVAPAILGQLPGTGTVLTLVGGDLEGASRSQSFDRLQQVLTDARGSLASGGSPSSALVLAARELTGSGQLSDPPSASRAGSPSGSGFLWVVLALVVLALLAVPVLLRRARRPRPTPPPQVLRDRVEIDSYGRVVRRVSARERADDPGTP